MVIPWHADSDGRVMALPNDIVTVYRLRQKVVQVRPHFVPRRVGRTLQ